MLELSNALREAGVSFVNKTFNQKINMFPEVRSILIFYQDIPCSDILLGTGSIFVEFPHCISGAVKRTSIISIIGLKDVQVRAWNIINNIVVLNFHESFPSRALAEVTEDHVQNKKTLRQALKDFSGNLILL